MTPDFAFYVEDDRIRVKFVSQKTLGRLTDEGHPTGGTYTEGQRVIRIVRGEYRTGQRAIFMHELGHYLVERQELDARNTTEEEVCDILSWLPRIYADERNADLLKFLGLKRGKQ